MRARCGGTWKILSLCSPKKKQRMERTYRGNNETYLSAGSNVDSLRQRKMIFFFSVIERAIPGRSPSSIGFVSFPVSIQTFVITELSSCIYITNTYQRPDYRPCDCVRSRCKTFGVTPTALFYDYCRFAESGQVILYTAKNT